MIMPNMFKIDPYTFDVTILSYKCSVCNCVINSPLNNRGNACPVCNRNLHMKNLPSREEVFKMRVAIQSMDKECSTPEQSNETSYPPPINVNSTKSPGILTIETQNFNCEGKDTIWYDCPDCENINIHSGANYCSGCGKKIQWI